MPPVTITVEWAMPLIHLISRTASALDDDRAVVWQTPEGRAILWIRPGRPWPTVETMGPGLGPREG
jgi:hypothetical protein